MNTQLIAQTVSVEKDEHGAYQLGWLDLGHADYDAPNGAPRPLCETWGEADADAIALALNSHENLKAALLGCALELERAGGKADDVNYYRGIAQKIINAEIGIMAKGGGQ